MNLVHFETTSAGPLLVNADEVQFVQPADGNRCDLVMRDGGRITVKGSLNEVGLKLAFG